MVSRTTKLGQMGRRGFIGGLLSLGVSGRAAASLTSQELEQLTDDPTKDVPQIKYYKHTNHEKVMAGKEPPQKEPVYYTIPRHRWVRIQSTINAAENTWSTIQSSEIDLSSLSSSTRIKVGITNRISSDELGVVVQLIAYPDKEGYSPISDRRRDEIKEHVPSQASGSVTYDGKTETRNSIPVKFENIEKQEQAYFDKKISSDSRRVSDEYC